MPPAVGRWAPLVGPRRADTSATRPARLTTRRTTDNRASLDEPGPPEGPGFFAPMAAIGLECAHAGPKQEGEVRKEEGKGLLKKIGASRQVEVLDELPPQPEQPAHFDTPPPAANSEESSASPAAPANGE